MRHWIPMLDAFWYKSLRKWKKWQESDSLNVNIVRLYSQNYKVIENTHNDISLNLSRLFIIFWAALVIYITISTYISVCYFRLVCGICPLHFAISSSSWLHRPSQTAFEIILNCRLIFNTDIKGRFTAKTFAVHNQW